MFINLPNGYQEMHTVSNQQHTTYQSCYIEKRGYRDSEGVEFMCGREDQFFNKQQRLY
jgi:hypothetical protein